MPGSSNIRRSAVRVAIAVAALLSVPLVATLVSDDVAWSAGDFVAAALLLAVIGGAIELAVARAGNVSTALAVATLGVAAAVFGEADDAPGLVLIGLVLVVSGGVLGLRRAQRVG